MTSKVIEIADGNGDTKRYQRFAARLPQFLSQYPPTEYRIESEFSDLLSHQPGFLKLLSAAIAAGKKPNDVGLPGVERYINTLVCTVHLFDAQGQIVREANATMDISVEKAYEKLETAANQRLLALLGFGGQVFNEDEDAILKSLGLSVAEPERPSDTGSQETASPAPASQPLSPSSPPVQVTPAPASGESKKGVSESLRLQVSNLAKRLGEPVPALESDEQGRRELARLGGIQRQRRTTVAA